VSMPCMCLKLKHIYSIETHVQHWNRGMAMQNIYLYCTETFTQYRFSLPYLCFNGAHLFQCYRCVLYTIGSLFTVNIHVNTATLFLHIFNVVLSSMVNTKIFSIGQHTIPKSNFEICN
jgi:hypothetical protein